MGFKSAFKVLMQTCAIIFISPLKLKQKKKETEINVHEKNHCLLLNAKSNLIFLTPLE
jgi:hypothetical protein